MDIYQLASHVEDAIRFVEELYQATPGLILTESDLKCLLYREISDIPIISAPNVTLNERIRAGFVHTEIAWFDNTGRLGITSDMVILDPRHLRICEWVDDVVCCDSKNNRWTFKRYKERISSLHPKYQWQPLPNKQYEFDGTAINIELKFARTTTDRIMKGIEEDYKKIKRLQAILDAKQSLQEVIHYIIVFSKYENGSENFAYWKSQNGQDSLVKIIWCHSGMMWPRY